MNNEKLIDNIIDDALCRNINMSRETAANYIRMVRSHDDGFTYQDTLEKGISVICKAMGIDTERYDTDQADIECYMDCFREAAELIKDAGYYFDVEANEFKRHG